MLRSLHGRINLVQESSQTTRGPGDLVPREGEKGNCPFQIHASLLGVVPGRAAPHHFMLQGKMRMSPRPRRHCSRLKSLLFVQKRNAVNTTPSFQNKFNTKIINAKWELKTYCWCFYILCLSVPYR